MKGKHTKARMPKGSTIIITVMYVTWVWFIFLDMWFYLKTYEITGCGVFLPAEVTLGTAAVFIGETVSLARYKLTKEGGILLPKAANKFLEQLGIYDSGGFEEMATEQSKKNEAAMGNG